MKSKKDTKIPITFESLSRVLNSEVKGVEDQQLIDKHIGEKLRKQYGFSLKEVHKLKRSLDSHLKKKYKHTFFTRQSKIDIVKQIIDLENRKELQQKKAFLEANEMLLVFNYNRLPDLNGNINKKVIVIDDEDEDEDDKDDEDNDDNEEVIGSDNDGIESEEENVNINGGLTNIKREEILQVVKELPSSDSIGSTNRKLCVQYDRERRKLLRAIEKLKQAKHRQIIYQEISRQIKKYSGSDGGDASTKELGDEVNKTIDITKKLLEKLQDPSKVDKLREKMEKALTDLE